MKMKNSHKTIIRGQEIKLFHLMEVMTKSQALVVNKLLYCLDRNYFCHVYRNNGASIRYVRRALDEWCLDLSIQFANKKSHKISRFTLCKTFKSLVDAGLLFKIKGSRNVPGYGINEDALISLLKKHNPELCFAPAPASISAQAPACPNDNDGDYSMESEVGQSTPPIRLSGDQKLQPKNDSGEHRDKHSGDQKLQPKNDRNEKKVQPNANRSATEVQPNANRSATECQSNANQSAINFTPAGLGNQGVCDFAGAGTSTSTDTSTNTKNKSHKSDESVEREISKKISEKIEVVFSNHNTDIVFDIQKLSKTKAGTVFDIQELSKTKAGTMFDIQELSKTKAGTMFDIQKLPPAPAEPSFQESNVKKSNIVQEMFRVWKSEFPGSEERLNLKISRWMKAAFDTKFQGNLQNWVDYLRLAKTSRFITENPHLLCLKWLLSFNAIEGICKRRAYGVAAAEPPPGAEGTESKAQTQATAQEIAEQIKNLDECEICKAQRLKILDRIGPCAYLSWFGKVSMKVVDIEIKCFDGGDGAASQFVLDRIAIHYRDLLRLDSEPNPETCPETC